VPSGILADRFGRKHVMLIIGLVSLAAGLLVLAAYASFSIADASYSGTDSALLYDTFDRTDDFEPRLGRLNGLLMADFSGMTIAGSLMVHWTSLRFPIMLSAVLTIPCLLIMWRITEPPARGGRTSIREISGRALSSLAPIQ